MPGARDLQDVAQHLIVHFLRDTTHRRVHCFDHQHPVYESEILFPHTVLYNQLQHVRIFQHLHEATRSAELSIDICPIARGVLSVSTAPLAIHTKMHLCHWQSVNAISQNAVMQKRQ
jgi:hypothetical protein